MRLRGDSGAGASEGRRSIKWISGKKTAKVFNVIDSRVIPVVKHPRIEAIVRFHPTKIRFSPSLFLYKRKKIGNIYI